MATENCISACFCLRNYNGWKGSLNLVIIKKIYLSYHEYRVYLIYYVLSIFHRPLLVTVKDLDEGVNSMIEFTILNNLAKEYFEMDSSTGAIKLLKQVDYELNKYFRFDVMVSFH